MPDITVIEKIPPHNDEAERSLLGAILITNDTITKVADIIQPDDFYKKAHEHIYVCMLELYEHNEPIDVLTVSNKLEDQNLLEHIGGKPYLVTLANAVPTASHAQQYAKIISRKATMRKLINVSQEITRLGFSEESDEVERILDEAQELIYGVTRKHIKGNFTAIKSVLSDAFERIDELHRDKGKLKGVPTGFTNLDGLLGGLQKSDLVILAARPSVGKTSFALDIARNAAVQHGKAVGVFSLEMSKEQLVDRLLCAEAEVDLWKMRTGNLSDKPGSEDFPRIGAAMSKLSEAKIFIDDSPGLNVMQVRTKCRRLQAEFGLDLVVIDYLQLMSSVSSKGSDNRVQEVAEISRNLKGIAREMNVPVLALAQLSRAVEQTKPAIPKLSHLRDSGSIEQDADVVMFIYRKSADRNYKLEDIPPDERHLGEIHVAKHRNGPTGVIKVFFDADKASYKNLDTMHTAPSMMPPSPPIEAYGAPSPPPPSYGDGMPPM